MMKAICYKRMGYSSLNQDDFFHTFFILKVTTIIDIIIPIFDSYNNTTKYRNKEYCSSKYFNC